MFTFKYLGFLAVKKRKTFSLRHGFNERVAQQEWESVVRNDIHAVFVELTGPDGNKVNWSPAGSR